jgi:hypothetical protein
LTIKFALFEVALIGGKRIGKFKDPLATDMVILELTLVETSTSKFEHSLAMAFTIRKGTLIARDICLTLSVLLRNLLGIRFREVALERADPIKQISYPSTVIFSFELALA